MVTRKVREPASMLVVVRVNSTVYDMVEKEVLERPQITRFEQETLEVWVEVTLESFVYWSEDGYVVVVFTNSGFEGLKEICFLD